MSFEFNNTDPDPYLGFEVDAVYDTAGTPGSEDPEDPYYLPLGPYWEAAQRSPGHTSNDEDRVETSNTGPPDPPDTIPPQHGEAPDDPDDSGVGRFEHYTPSAHEAIATGILFLQESTVLFAKGRLQNYIDYNDDGKEILRLEVNTQRGQALVTVTNRQEVAIQYDNTNDSVATHHYNREDGVVRYHIEDIWTVFDEIEAPIETTDEHGFQALLLPPTTPDPSRLSPKPRGRIVGTEELTGIFGLAAEADPVNVPFAHLRDTALQGFTRPLRPESDEPAWAGHEFAGYVRAGLELYAEDGSLSFKKSITNAATKDKVDLEAGENPDPHDETIRNPYAHVLWTHAVDRTFLSTVPAKNKEEQAAIDAAQAGTETIAISYSLTNGELKAVYRRSVITFTSPEHLFIGSGRLHVRCPRSVARDLRNFFRNPIA